MVKRYEARKRFMPTGGVRYPSSRFTRKIIPRCSGSMLNTWLMGRMSGTTTTIAEKMSIRQPTIRRKIFRKIRNKIREWMCSRTHAAACIGTSASTR